MSRDFLIFVQKNIETPQCDVSTFFDSILALSENRLGVLFSLTEFLDVDGFLKSLTFDD